MKTPNLNAVLKWVLPIIQLYSGDVPPASTSTSSQYHVPPPTVTTNSLGPQATYVLTNTQTGATVKKSTRDPKVFDLHMADDLTLKRVVLLPNLAAKLGEISDNAVDERSPTDLPDRHIWSSTEYKIAQHTWDVSHVVSGEQQVSGIYEKREKLSSFLASNLLSNKPERWSPNPEDDIFRYQEGSPYRIAKGLGDGILSVNPPGLSQEPPSSLKTGLELAISEKLSPFIVWEYKDSGSAPLSVLLAMREMAENGDDFLWQKCGSPGPVLPGAKGNAERIVECGNKNCSPTLRAGTRTGLDSDVMIDFVQRAFEESDSGQDATLNAPETRVKITPQCREKALNIFQQVGLHELWCQLRNTHARNFGSPGQNWSIWMPHS